MDISGYPARIETVETQTSGGQVLTLTLYTPARPEDLVDRGALLNAQEVPEPPYWALLWTGARALASRLLAHPPPRSASVLDLGCGLGLSGLAAARGGAPTMFVDKVAECLNFVEASALLNGIESHQTRQLDFTHDQLERRFDLILAADIVYEPNDYEPLASFLDLHLASGGAIWLTESLRADAKTMLATMAERGFVDETEACWVQENGRRERTWLHRLERESPGA